MVYANGSPPQTGSEFGGQISEAIMRSIRVNLCNLTSNL